MVEIKDTITRDRSSMERANANVALR